MAKTQKKAKQRIDKYYKKAKIAGYRARSAYKLLQIEKKYGLLQGSRVCIDLCAAPGSWMQVAKQKMPLSSIIIGVDLFAIKYIPGTISLLGDITTDKLRQELKGKLTTWKADIVLHDGSPKVGQNWLQDAYSQNLLVLSAFKLACEFLRSGGSFVTKVFRSKDYFKLEYVFKKLFKNVDATKPDSSRFESAEIFVVCRGFLDPAKVDQEFFNPKSVFAEIDPEPVDKINLWKPAKTKAKAEGYPEGATTLYTKIAVSEFIHASNFSDLLLTASELHFEEDQNIRNHKLTTETIVEFCQDIKVLGRKELKQLLTWRKAVKADLDMIKEKKEKLQKLENEQRIAEGKTELENLKEEEENDKELAAIEKEIAEIRSEQARSAKKREKKLLRAQRKLKEKMRMQCLVPGDEGPTETSKELFSLERLSKVHNMDAVVDQGANEVLSESEEEQEERGKKFVVYPKEGQRLDRTGRFWMGKNDKEIDESEEDDDEEEITKESLDFKEDGNSANVNDAPGSDEDVDEVVNPLLTDLVGDSREARRARKADAWFKKGIFQSIDNEEEEDDLELDKAIQNFEKKGGVLQSKSKEKEKKKGEKKTSDEGYTSGAHSDEEVARDAPVGYTESETGTDSDSDSESENEGDSEKCDVGPVGGALTNATSKKRKADEGLSPLGLALAAKMMHSKKTKRDIMDAGWS
ncbi:pre-rRNA processing protein ftsj3, partial [Halocaridina rubra]